MLMRINNVKKSFNHVPVLKDVNMEIHQGDVVVILGPSGSGKTTFLRCLNFLEQADGGEMQFHDTHLSLNKASRHEIAEIRRKTAFVFQNYNLFANKTALENVTLGLTAGRGVGKKQAREIGMAALAKVGMSERADYYPSQLSGGQQQRVGIARAIAVKPDVILFDEPTSALDGPSQAVVQQAIDELYGVTMLVVAHRLSTLRTMDRIIVLHEGRVVQDGRYDQLSEEEGYFAQMLESERWNAA